MGFGIRGMQERVQAWAAAMCRGGAAAAAPRAHRIPVPRRRRFVSRQRVMTSVLIIDDHPIVLQGCRRVLEDAGVESVLEARDLISGYRLYRRHQPGVVIVDLGCRGTDSPACR